MIRPTGTFAVLFGAAAVIALLPVFGPASAWTIWASVLGALLGLFLVDAVLAAPGSRFEFSADWPRRLFVGRDGGIRCRAALPPRRSAGALRLRLEHDEDLGISRGIQDVPLGADGSAGFDLAVRPGRRGAHAIRAVRAEWRGPLRLAARTSVLSLDARIPVVPDLETVGHRVLRFFSDRDVIQGLKRERFVGEGTEFDRLREFMPGLDVRSIDWKASARHAKLLSRQFRAETNHSIILSFDTGQLMSEPIDGVTRLDHAVNAALILAFACLKAGDRVGLHAFDERQRLFRREASGSGAFAAIQHDLSAIEYGSGETNFALSMAELSLALPRRSLVVVFTEFVDTITAELMAQSLERLRSRHLVLFVTTRDVDLQRHEDSEPTSLARLCRSVVASDLLRERRSVLHRLQRSGISVIETAPSQLSIELLDRYVEMKRREFR